MSDWFSAALAEELSVGELVCPFAGPTLLFQEQTHAVLWRVSYAAAPQGLRNPQQLSNVCRDDLQRAHSRGVQVCDHICLQDMIDLTGLY